MKFDLKTILLIGIAVLLTIQIKSCFDPRNKDEAWKVELKHLEEDKRELQEQNETLKQDVQILWADIRHKDSIYNLKKGTIEYRIKSIPLIVDAMGDDDLKLSIEKRFGNTQ